MKPFYLLLIVPMLILSCNMDANKKDDGLVYITDSRAGKILTYKDGKVSAWIT